VKKCSSDTRRLEFYTLARWTTMSRRVFYSPFWRRNSMRIAPVFFGQPCLFLRFLYYYYSLRSQAFDRWRFLPQVRFGFALLRLFDFRLGVLQSCFADWCLPLPLPLPCLLRCHLDSWFSPVLRRPPRLHLYIFVRTFAFITQLIFDFVL
jgi:hypothetical protein